MENFEGNPQLDEFRASLARFRHSETPRTRSARDAVGSAELADEGSSVIASDSERLKDEAAELNRPPASPSKRQRPSADVKSKKPRLSRTPSAQTVSAENNLKDSLREGLILISIGLNPGIMTGKTGHAYCHPTNRYWPTLFASGITPIQHKPEETHALMDLYGMGHTNIVTTIASRDGSTLTTADYMTGAAALEAKIRRYRPEAVVIVGKGIWQEWTRYKTGRKFNTKTDRFEYGWQDPKLWLGREASWEGAKTFVATTTSGASTLHSKEERVAIWKPLGEWFAPKREQWAMPT